MKILLVEDDQRVVEATKVLIQSLTTGIIDFTVASDKDGATRRAVTERFDAMVLDLKLPDSPEPTSTLDAFNELMEYLPTVVVSGYADSHISMLAIEHGAMGCVLKADLDSMKDAFKELLVRARREKEEATGG